MPKISVLIPMYNRKHYIEDCVNSALNQTFQDFEIIVRDDGSTDGVFEFVQEKYSKEISNGKIKLFRNEKNLGESLNVGRLLRDGTGKYLTILHSDDMYLPQALEIFFNAAEKFNADVVHITNIFISPKDGIINEDTHLKKISMDRQNVTTAEIISTDLHERFFNQWLNGGIFHELQYNIFSRKFITDNKIFISDMYFEGYLFTLVLLLRAKIIVKIPDMVYVRRDAPDSQSNDINSSLHKFKTALPMRLKIFLTVDKFISECDFLKNDAELCYLVKTKIFMALENLNIDGENIMYGNKSYVNLYGTIEDTCRNFFGDNAVYLALFFHWAHLMPYGKSVDKIIIFPPPLPKQLDS